jgi:hypothetical protein
MSLYEYLFRRQFTTSEPRERVEIVKETSMSKMRRKFPATSHHRAVFGMTISFEKCKPIKKLEYLNFSQYRLNYSDNTALVQLSIISTSAKFSRSPN